MDAGVGCGGCTAARVGAMDVDGAGVAGPAGASGIDGAELGTAAAALAAV